MGVPGVNELTAAGAGLLDCGSNIAIVVFCEIPATSGDTIPQSVASLFAAGSICTTPWGHDELFAWLLSLVVGL